MFDDFSGFAVVRIYCTLKEIEIYRGGQKNVEIPVDTINKVPVAGTQTDDLYTQYQIECLILLPVRMKSTTAVLLLMSGYGPELMDLQHGRVLRT